MQQQRAVCALQRVIGIVSTKKHAATAGFQAQYFVEDQRLIAEIQTRSRLVHDEQWRLLCKRARDQGKLTFTAADLGDCLIGQMGDVEFIHRSVCCRDVFYARPVEESQMRGAAHQHHVAHGEGKVGVARLRHVGHQARAFGIGATVQRLAAQ